MRTDKTLRNLNMAKRLVFVTIIIYIVVFFVVNSSYLSADNIERFAYTLKKTLTESYGEGTQKRVSMMYDEGEEEIVFKDGFAIMSTGTLSVYSSDMIRFSTHTVGYKQPVLMASDEFLLCFDRGGKKLSLYDSFDLLTEKTFEKNILNVAISDDGHFSVITESEGYKGLVTIYDSNFKEVMQWYSADYYLLYSGFTSRNTLSVVTVKPNNENMDIYVINLNYRAGEERKVVCAENRFPMDAKVKSDSTLEVVTDLDIITFRSEGFNSIYSYGSSNIYTYKQFDEYSVIVSIEDSVKELYMITAVDSVGNVMFETLFENFGDIKYYNGYFYILGDCEIVTLNNKGNQVGRLEVSADVYRILVSRGFALLIEPEQINLIDSSKLFEYQQSN